MRYENYQKRISRIADVLRTVLKRWPLFLLQFMILAAAVTAFLLTKGAVLSVDCTQSIAYGDEIQCKSVAFLSKTHIEYLTDSGEWTTDAPTMPGEYQLRVVGKGFFGKKASDPTSFTIKKREIFVHSADGTVNYGENPALSANLAFNDTLSCTEFEVGNIFARDTESNLYVPITPLKDTIVIKNAGGEDVTWAYDINTEREDLKIIPRKITVTVQNASKTYDGVAFSFDGYELSDGSLADGDSLFAYFTRSIVDAGSIENTPNLVLMNESGIDVTLCYEITVVKGMLTVEKRPLIIKTASGQFNYDATPHSANGYEISTDTPLVAGQNISIIWSEKTDAGEYENIPTSVTVTALQNDTTNNYSIFFEAGILKINPLPITVTTPSKTLTYQGAEQKFSYFGILLPSGSGNLNLLKGHKLVLGESSAAIDVGVYENDTTILVYDMETEEDVTHNYDITYIRGTIYIQKLSLTLQTASGEWVYDGTPHYKKEFTSGFVGYNDKIVVTDATPAQEVGACQNVLSIKVVREVPKPEGGEDQTVSSDEEELIDVTHNYNIEFLYGILTVTKRSITFKPTDASKVYDGTPLTSTTIQVSKKSENALPLGHSVFRSETSGDLTDVGTLTNYIVPSSIIIHDASGKDVTKNFTIHLSVGLLTVTPREILIQTNGAVKKYDGAPLQNASFTVVSEAADSLVEGHTINVENIGSISRVGKTENICHLDKTKIYDATGKDVTHNYLISYSYGILEIYGDSNTELSGGGFNESGTIGSFKGELGSSKDDITVELPSLLSVLDERNGYIYLRLKSFGGYNGNAWYEATEYPELLLGKFSANYLASFALSGSVRELSVLAKNPYFFLPYYTSADNKDHFAQVSDVFYNSIQTSGLETLYTVSYNDYDYGTRIALPAEYAEYEEAYRAFVYSQYLILDDETRAYMEGIIEDEKFLDKDIETILSVAKYIQNSALYKVDYDETLDREANVAIAFLETYGEGISQHFASALTLLYRAMGIPARYTVGFATPTCKEEWVEIDRSCVHAWVEVYIDGVGWIEIEATGGPNFGLNGSGGKPKKQEIVVKPIYRAKTYDGITLYPSSLIEYDPTLAALASQGYFWTVKFTGNITEVGRTDSVPTSFVLYDPSGNIVTDQYNIVFEHGILEIFDPSAIVIQIKLPRLQKYYDGTPLSFNESDYTITSNTSLTDIDVNINLDSLIDVGYLTLSELNENIGKYVSISFRSGGVNNQNQHQKVAVMFTDYNYSSSILTSAMVEPILKVSPRTITVMASSASKIYDGTPLTSDGAYISRGSLVSGHKMSVTVKGSLTEPGTATNSIVHVTIINQNGEDVTANYVITSVDGYLSVYRYSYSDGKG